MHRLTEHICIRLYMRWYLTELQLLDTSCLLKIIKNNLMFVIQLEALWLCSEGTSCKSHVYFHVHGLQSHFRMCAFPTSIHNVPTLNHFVPTWAAAPPQFCFNLLVCTLEITFHRDVLGARGAPQQAFKHGVSAFERSRRSLQRLLTISKETERLSFIKPVGPARKLKTPANVSRGWRDPLTNAVGQRVVQSQPGPMLFIVTSGVKWVNT